MWHRSSFDELFDVFRDFDSLFRRTFSDAAPAVSEGRPLLTSGTDLERAPAALPGRASLPRWGYVPAVESYVKDGTLFLRAELPGVDPQEIRVSVTGNTLTISGEKKAAREVDEANVYVREMSLGRFERSFRLPQGVKGDQLKARYDNGVLELSVPAPASVEPKQVQIEIVAGSKPAKAA